MASAFHGEGGKGSIKSVHHQNAVDFCFLFLGMFIFHKFLLFFLNNTILRLQAVVWGLPALSLTFPLWLKNQTKMVFVDLKFKLGSKEQKGFKMLSRVSCAVEHFALSS